jgi:quinol monooxygenase YgiN
MIAKMRVPPENAEAYEALMDRVTAMTRANEPGVIYYGWARSAGEEGVYVVVEVYEDEQVHAAHMASEWVVSSLPVSRSLVTGGFEIQQFVSPGQEPVQLRHG